MLRRRGAAEAGAIFVSVDRLDGTVDLYAPAPQASLEENAGDRMFERVMAERSPLDVAERMDREVRFDPDLWWLGIDDRAGRHLLDLVRPASR